VACLHVEGQVSAYMTGSFQQAVPPYKNLINHNTGTTPTAKVITETVNSGGPWLAGATTPAAAEVISSNVLRT